MTSSYSYRWADQEQSILIREDSLGAFTSIPADPANRDYAEFLASGAVAAPYVAPPAPLEPTAAEKLAAAGLTVEELKALLAG